MPSTKLLAYNVNEFGMNSELTTSGFVVARDLSHVVHQSSPLSTVFDAGEAKTKTIRTKLQLYVVKIGRFLADRTATRNPVVRPSVCLSVTLCILTLRISVRG